MKLKFDKQTNVISMLMNEADDSVEASFVIAFNIAQTKRPYILLNPESSFEKAEKRF